MLFHTLNQLSTYRELNGQYLHVLEQRFYHTHIVEHCYTYYGIHSALYHSFFKFVSAQMYTYMYH